MRMARETRSIADASHMTDKFYVRRNKIRDDRA